MKRSFAHIDTFTLPLIYKTLVRPHLEYGNLAWGPFGKTDQKSLERVQRRATRLVPNLKPLAYEERLRILKLPSLYYRRSRGDMIAVYQILSGGMSLDAEELFKPTLLPLLLQDVMDGSLPNQESGRPYVRAPSVCKSSQNTTRSHRWWSHHPLGDRWETWGLLGGVGENSKIKIVFIEKQFI